jgi:hypothetical protein
MRLASFKKLPSGGVAKWPSPSTIPSILPTFKKNVCMINCKNVGWVGLGMKPDFFIYLVKPEPELGLRLTYLIFVQAFKSLSPKRKA